mmetsp:Transcript_27115/g.37252  ORF Transcript_27115/g.37252 Transcript_27115/m.37252 type:complete len:89 (-) Transcript_27115:126-392(-)
MRSIILFLKKTTIIPIKKMKSHLVTVRVMVRTIKALPFNQITLRKSEAIKVFGEYSCGVEVRSSLSYSFLQLWHYFLPFFVLYFVFLT